MKFIKPGSGLLFVAFVLHACTKDFLQKPVSNTTTVDSVFTTKLTAQQAIAIAYAYSLPTGIPVVNYDPNHRYGMNQNVQGNISGELMQSFSWDDAYNIINRGMAANDGTSNANNARSDDSYPFNYTAIRQNYNVLENIDRVTDMSATEKAQVKAEMLALTAYRYTEMFVRYGGVPIVKKALTSTDDLKISRASLQQTLDFIVATCDTAAAVLPNSYPPTFTGRITKGVALAIKARALMFAARPLFNTSNPYLSTSNTSLICFGSADATRWEKAAEAAKAVIDWGRTNGYQIINTGDPLADYGSATSTPSNQEVLLAFKNNQGAGLNDLFNLSQVNGNSWEAYGGLGLTTAFLEMFHKADGTDQTWASTAAALPYNDYNTKMQQMEPRLKASVYAFGINAWNNPNDVNWSSARLFQWQNPGGSALSTKFYYKAGTRPWFEFPLYRLAEFYLDAAEAYNETGNIAMALPYLNVIRSRAGLPNVAITSQATLRTTIVREWACEFFNESKWLHLEKHWKLPNIGNGLIGGPIRNFFFTYNTNSGINPSDYNTYVDKVQYTGFWAPSQFLNPFPQNEVNKGVIIQNPGY